MDRKSRGGFIDGATRISCPQSAKLRRSLFSRFAYLDVRKGRQGLVTQMKKDTISTSLWDPSEHLETDEDRVMYLESALEDGDPVLIAAVLGDIARAKGMMQK